LQDEPACTQFGRVLAELGIEWIAAHSSQANGSIKRLGELGCPERVLCGHEYLQISSAPIQILTSQIDARFLGSSRKLLNKILSRSEGSAGGKVQWIKAEH
jgi:hypothetical protein